MKGLLFDLDGTLLDTLADLAASCNFALRKHGLPERTLNEVRRFVGNGVRLLIQRALPDGKACDFEAVFSDFRAHYALHSQDQTKPYPGMVSLLQRLKEEGFSIGIVSNKPDAEVKKLAEHHFPGLCSAAIGEREGVPKKPDPTSVFACARELSAAIDMCVYIGDSEVDLETSRNAGIPCISVTWGFREKEEIQALGQTVFAADHEELYRKIKEWAIC